MKVFGKIIISAALLLGSSAAAHAQYYQMVNQSANMLQTAALGGFNYRGMIDVSYTAGVGSNGCGSLEFSTTQGVKYANWFFMGLGAGVNVVFAGDGNKSPEYGRPQNNWGDGWNTNNGVRDTGVIIPLFTDFRFIIGNETNIGVFFDIKAGASFLVGKDYLRTPDGYLDNSEGFYLKPSIGMRVPLSRTNPRQAMNIAASYQLITNSYWDWYGYYSGTTINSVGVTVGFEW